MKIRLTLKFPDIDRQCDFVAQPGIGDAANSEAGGYGFGCHVRWLTDLYLLCQPGTLKTLDGKTIAADRYGSIPYAENQKLNEAITKYYLTEEECIPLYNQLIEQFSPPDQTDWNDHKQGPQGSSFVIMSDNVNNWSTEFPKCSGVPKPNAARGFKCVNFVEYLVKNKIGFVMGSPICRNALHQSEKNFSLTQAYIWIPPNHLKYAMPSSWFMSGRGSLPSWDRWYRSTSEKLNKPYLTQKDYVDKNLFRNGVPYLRHSSHRMAEGKTVTGKSLSKPLDAGSSS